MPHLDQTAVFDQTFLVLGALRSGAPFILSALALLGNLCEPHPFILCKPGNLAGVLFGLLDLSNPALLGDASVVLDLTALGFGGKLLDALHICNARRLFLLALNGTLSGKCSTRCLLNLDVAKLVLRPRLLVSLVTLEASLYRLLACNGGVTATFKPPIVHAGL